MKTKFLLFGLLASFYCYGQDIAKRLAVAVKKLEADSQFKHAALSIYVVDSKTGKPVFAKNEQTGLAPASCQKVVTSVSAFEMLGSDYFYTTSFTNYSDVSYKDVGERLVIEPSGDPSLGSWRWPQTKPELLFQGLAKAFKDDIKETGFKVVVKKDNWSSGRIPGGWTWEDIGNYFGAGAGKVNWRENQYDLYFKTADVVGSKASIVKTEPTLYKTTILCEVKAANKNTGDNTIIYLPEDTAALIVRGTIPISQSGFKVSGAIPNVLEQFKFEIGDKPFCCNDKKHDPVNNKEKKCLPKFYQHHSPSFDSLNYWFLKKSINLYGEAFVKTIAYVKTKFGDIDTGIAIIKNFWQQKGIEPSALNIIDGSGLSPTNRVTTHALVTVMQYAKKQSWYNSFYNALPEINGIKMKDGYIGGVRSYTGYIKNKNSGEYIFSFIVNNFSGSAVTVREKMWKVLDVLK